MWRQHATTACDDGKQQRFCEDNMRRRHAARVCDNCRQWGHATTVLWQRHVTTACDDGMWQQHPTTACNGKIKISIYCSLGTAPWKWISPNCELEQHQQKRCKAKRIKGWWCGKIVLGIPIIDKPWVALLCMHAFKLKKTGVAPR